MQFPEHANGGRSTDQRVRKLDKLATLLRVSIEIDGVKYGEGSDQSPTEVPVITPASEPVVETTPTQKVKPTKTVAPKPETVKAKPKATKVDETKAETPAPKPRGRKPKAS